VTGSCGSLSKRGVRVKLAAVADVGERSSFLDRLIGFGPGWWETRSGGPFQEGRRRDQVRSGTCLGEGLAPGQPCAGSQLTAGQTPTLLTMASITSSADCTTRPCLR